VVLNISSFAVFLIQRRAMEVTRQLCAVDITVARYPPYLPLVPSIYPWTLLTATFVEQNIFTVVLNAATLFYGGKYLERAWGRTSLAISLISWPYPYTSCGGRIFMPSPKYPKWYHSWHRYCCRVFNKLNKIYLISQSFISTY
jgi:Eukaryotic integral membrane protein (DUF1751)